MNTLLTQLVPNEYVESVYDIDLDKLWKAGKRLILSDLDNTLVPWNHPHVPASLAKWYEEITQRGFQLCIVSNNKGPRVSEFAKKMGIEAIGAAHKPRPKAFVDAMKRFNRSRQETVMVGDQLFTDVRGGNRCDLYTVLVVPIEKQEWWGTKINRIIERFVVRVFLRKAITQPHRRAADGGKAGNR